MDAGSSCDEHALAMECCFSRDLLRGIGGGDTLLREDGPRPPQVEMEEVELSLGLSLGGRFGLERRVEKLARSYSVAAILMPPEKMVAPPALARTSSLPVKAEAVEVGMKSGLEGCENGGLGAEAAARLPGSGSPSSTSSDGEGQRLQGVCRLSLSGGFILYLAFLSTIASILAFRFHDDGYRFDTICEFVIRCYYTVLFRSYCIV